MSFTIKGSDFPSDRVAGKCAEQYKSLAKKKEISMKATGDQKNNALVTFLQCQVKATKTCKEWEKEYTLCHKSFMGMGSYKGKRHCGEELTALYQCAWLGPGFSRLIEYHVAQSRNVQQGHAERPMHETT